MAPVGLGGSKLGTLLSTVVQVLTRGRNQGVGESSPVNRIGEFSLCLGCNQRDITSVPDKDGAHSTEGNLPRPVGFGLT